MRSWDFLHAWGPAHVLRERDWLGEDDRSHLLEQGRVCARRPGWTGKGVTACARDLDKLRKDRLSDVICPCRANHPH